MCGGLDILVTAVGERSLTKCIFFTGFSEETEEAETYGSGVNVNKVQHSYYKMTVPFFCDFFYFYLLTWT